MHAETDGTLVLAQKKGFGEITMCSCGVLSMHLGSTTIRFESAALSHLDDLVQAALDSMMELATRAREGNTLPATGLIH